MEIPFASHLMPGFAAGCVTDAVLAPGRGFEGTERGTRLLVRVTGALDLIIRVLCMFKMIVVLLREGSPGLGGGPPKRRHPELGTVGISVFLASPKPSGCKNTPGAHLRGAREGFCCVCVAAPSKSGLEPGKKNLPPPFFFFFWSKTILSDCV